MPRTSLSPDELATRQLIEWCARIERRRKAANARTGTTFTTTLWELVELTERLLSVVDETMQPTQISLWQRHTVHPAAQT